MILGLSIETFTFLHVVLSLIGVMTGFIVAALMLSNAAIAGWNGFFLVSTALTSITGFLFPFRGFGSGHALGIVSLILLAIAMVAVWGCRLSGVWRPVYVGTALAALYLNVVVGIVQSFQKFVYLHQFAPNGAESPLVVTQLVLLILFIILGIAAVRRYHPKLGGWREEA
jgi:hypothetical protein